MPESRIKSHPILPDTLEATIPFYWNDQQFLARPGEMLSSALIANGVRVFGHHPKDQSPQGLFCANGQCSQCMVIADLIPVKSCMTPVKAGMQVKPANGLPALPDVPFYEKIETKPAPEKLTDVLIIGGGPAGLSAAIELGKLGIQTLLIDDKDRLGGKLVLQTHRFFGSSEAVYAGTRGIDIAKRLESEVRSLPAVETWLRSTALGIFEDQSVGVFREAEVYTLVRPKVLLVCSGAREKSLAFPGNTLPGVYGAGAFQTLANRDLVRPCQNIFIIGGGNVGLIAGYHAIQAGINVVGLVEAAPQCGGYKVHQDKLIRSGVKILTSHTVVAALGEHQVEKVLIAEVDNNFQTIPGTLQEIACDTVLVAVGLDPVNEFISKANQVGLPVFSAGDAHEIAEASAAIFSGKITGNRAAEYLHMNRQSIPDEWERIEEILKSRPGKTVPEPLIDIRKGVFPVMHCSQEIPCNPCSTVCPRNLIHVDETDIRRLPEFFSNPERDCIACARCVAVCPGLAISLVDFRKSSQVALVSLPYEMPEFSVSVGQTVEVTNTDGEVLAALPVVATKKVPGYRDGTTVVTVESPAEIATQIAGVRLIPPSKPAVFEDAENNPEILNDDAYICRCERVTAGEIRALIRSGVRDINQIKAVTKASMGACGGKTCLGMIKRMYQSEGIPLSDVTETPVRPVFIEMPIAILAGSQDCQNEGGQ